MFTSYELTLIAIIFALLTYLLRAKTEHYTGNYNVVPRPVISYYKYAAPTNDNIVVGLHYTNWCGYCKLMKPIWDQVKLNLAGYNVVFLENDEELAKTPGISSYPTIIRYYKGEARQYEGRADYDTLRSWILNPVRPRL